MIFSSKLNKIIIISIIFSGIIFNNLLAYGEVRYLGSGYRDPLKSLLPKAPAESKIKPPNLNIQGIIWNTDNPSVIVKTESGQSSVLNIGDSISGAKILDINQKGIMVLFSGEKFLLK